MKRACCLAVLLALALGMDRQARACGYDPPPPVKDPCFLDVIDTWHWDSCDNAWRPGGCSSTARVSQVDWDQWWMPGPLSYTHDITDDMPPGVPLDWISEAHLELTFTGDIPSLDCCLPEYVKVGYDGTDWQYLDEVDNEWFDLVVEAGLLQSDGELDVTVVVTNCWGTAYLDRSRLYGWCTPPPPPPVIPEPVTTATVGMGLLALVRYARKGLVVRRSRTVA